MGVLRHIGDLSDASSLVVGPGDVLAHLRTTDAAASTLNATLSTCKALPPNTLTAWKNFFADYTAFSTKKKSVWGNALINLLTIGIIQQAQLRDDDAKTTDYETQLRDWQAIAKKTCGLDAPVLPSTPDTPGATTAKTIEHIAIAGAFVVGVGALLFGYHEIRRLF